MDDDDGDAGALARSDNYYADMDTETASHEREHGGGRRNLQESGHGNARRGERERVMEKSSSDGVEEEPQWRGRQRRRSLMMEERSTQVNAASGLSYGYVDTG